MKSGIIVISIGLVLVGPWSPRLHAQIKTPLERLADLETRLAELAALEERLRDLENSVQVLEDEHVPEGFLTRTGERFELGGKFELNFIDTQTERNAPIDVTREPDPHFEIDTFRLEPRIELNREISLHAQIDFKPREGEVVLKEATVRHRVDPHWWLRSDAMIGLDDPFFRPRRDTENYPLIGNAFWRDESLAFWWSVRLGDRDGRSAATAGAAGGSSGAPAASVAQGPFDFQANPGAVTFHFSVGNGYRLDANEVGFDRAAFNDIVQDDRNVDEDFSLRQLGFGIGYGRNLATFGEIDVLGFYMNDELSGDSVSFLQNDLTRRDFAGNVVGGYGDSNKDSSYRYGIGAEYFLAMANFSPDADADDGVRLHGQWISAKDGDLHRDGWYVEAAYRYSFANRLLFDRYFSAVTPLVRYGDLKTDITPDPMLPGTWDREEILLGAIVEVTGDILFKIEYTFFDEDPGPGAPKNVDNNEFLVQLRVDF